MVVGIKILYVGFSKSTKWNVMGNNTQMKVKILIGIIAVIYKCIYKFSIYYCMNLQRVSLSIKECLKCLQR